MKPSARVDGLAIGDAPVSQTSVRVILIEDGRAIVPDVSALLQGTFARVGGDLVITAPDGDKYIVQGFFEVEPRPALTDGEGVVVAGDVAARLAGPLAPGEVAQAGEQIAQDASAIGTVQTLTGEVTAVRADGTVVTLKVGDPVYQDDIIDTAAGAKIGIVFVDETTMALGENGEMVLDQLVYDPASQSGTAKLNLLAGAASFVSGKIAKSGNDNMQLGTPVATIGIRGTAVTVILQPDGNIQIVNRPERGADGQTTVGEIVLTLPNGQVVGTVNNVNGGWQWNATQGQTPTTTTFTEAQISRPSPPSSRLFSRRSKPFNSNSNNRISRAASRATRVAQAISPAASRAAKATKAAREDKEDRAAKAAAKEAKATRAPKAIKEPKAIKGIRAIREPKAIKVTLAIKAILEIKEPKAISRRPGKPTSKARQGRERRARIRRHRRRHHHHHLLLRRRRRHPRRLRLRHPFRRSVLASIP